MTFPTASRTSISILAISAALEAASRGTIPASIKASTISHERVSGDIGEVIYQICRSEPKNTKFSRSEPQRQELRPRWPLG